MTSLCVSRSVVPLAVVFATVACGGQQATVPDNAPAVSVTEPAAETDDATTPEPTPASPSDIWFDEAHAAVVRGDCVGALVGLDEVLAAAPWRDDALLDRSVCRLIVGDVTGAVHDARALVEVAASDPIGQYQLGASLVAAGFPEEASEVLSALIGHPQLARDARLRLAEARLALNDAAGADEAVASLADDPDALVLRGVVAEIRQTVPAAVAFYEAALSIDDVHLAALRNLGLLMLAEDAPEEARPLLQRFLELAPEGALDRATVEGHVSAL